MNTDESSDILIEVLEVFLNHILYVRGLYPTQIFKKRRVYNTPIYVSIFPPLNAYLYKVLQTARELKRNKELQRLELLFYCDAMVSYERYSFQLSGDLVLANNYQDDNFLLNFEEQLRAALYMLAERVKPLNKLPRDTKFRVLLHTTQAGFVRLSHNSTYQDFPWLHESLSSEPDKETISILPMAKVDSMGVQITAEVF